MQNLLLIVNCIPTFTFGNVPPVKTIELTGIYVSESTVNNPSANTKAIKIDCALVSASICARITIPTAYVVPKPVTTYHSIQQDSIVNGQLIQIETPIQRANGILEEITQSDIGSNTERTELTVSEVNYSNFISAPPKEKSVYGIYLSHTTIPIVVVSPSGPLNGGQTTIVCAIVSNQVCYKITIGNQGIPDIIDPVSQHGVLPMGYYRNIIVNNELIEGNFYSHHQYFTDYTLQNRSHVLQYQRWDLTIS